MATNNDAELIAEMLAALRACEKALGIRPDPKSERATQLYLDACKAMAKARSAD